MKTMANFWRVALKAAAPSDSPNMKILTCYQNIERPIKSESTHMICVNPTNNWEFSWFLRKFGEHLASIVNKVFQHQVLLLLRLNQIPHLKGQLQGHTAMLAARLLKILATLPALRITYQSCFPRSPPLPPLAPAPFKICAHFWKGCWR